MRKPMTQIEKQCPLVLHRQPEGNWSATLNVPFMRGGGWACGAVGQTPEEALLRLEARLSRLVDPDLIKPEVPA